MAQNQPKKEESSKSSRPQAPAGRPAPKSPAQGNKPAQKR